MDSSEFDYFQGDELKFIELLYEDFKRKQKKKDTIPLLKIDEFKVLDWDDYSADLTSYPKSIYLIVHRHIQVEEYTYVQLEFREVEQRDMYFSHNFYIKVDTTGNVVNWWTDY